MSKLLYPRSTRGGYTVLPLSVLPSVQDIFRRIFLSNYWWQKSDISSQASYRYPIKWEAFFDPSDSYFLFAEQRGYHKWALAHSSSCNMQDLCWCFNHTHIGTLWQHWKIPRYSNYQQKHLASTVLKHSDLYISMMNTYYYQMWFFFS